MLRPGHAPGNIGRLQGSEGNQIARALAQMDAALFRDLTQKDVLKLLDVLGRVSPDTAALPKLEKMDDIELTRSTLIEHENIPAAFSSAQPSTTHVEISADALHAARFRAEARLFEAEDAINRQHLPRLPDWDAPPQALLRVSQNMFDQGNYLNYLRSGEVAQAVLDGLHAPLPPDQQQPAPHPARTREWRTLAQLRTDAAQLWFLPLLGLLVCVLLYMLLR